MKARRPIVPTDMKEIYVGRGQYSIKFLIETAISQVTSTAEVFMFDCLGNKFPCLSKRWGTKVNLSFTVDDLTPDGAAIVEIELKGQKPLKERFRVWIIK